MNGRRVDRCFETVEPVEGEVRPFWRIPRGLHLFQMLPGELHLLSGSRHGSPARIEPRTHSGMLGASKSFPEPLRSPCAWARPLEASRIPDAKVHHAASPSGGSRTPAGTLGSPQP